MAHFGFGGDNDVAFDSLGRESLPIFHVPAIDGFGEGGYCRVVETCVIKIDSLDCIGAFVEAVGVCHGRGKCCRWGG